MMKHSISLQVAVLGFQHIRLWGFFTPAIHLDAPKKSIKISGISFEQGNNETISDVFRFVNECHKTKQFAPIYSVDDLDTPRLKDLKAEDFYLAIRENEIVGVIAAWDQSGFRQTHIHQYSSWLQAIKPIYNMVAKVSYLKPLLEEGSKVPFFYASHIAIKENDTDIFRALLREVYNDRRQGDWHYFICGLHESDPLAEVLKEYRSINAGGNLFCAHYPEGAHYVKSLDNRIPYIEAATL